MRKSWKYLILIFLAIIILRIPALYQPVLDMDESVFGEFACKIMDGGIPYIDAVDNKPPLTYYFFAFVYLLFGENNLIAVHVVTTFIVIVTAFLIFLVCRKFVDERAGIISAVIFTALAHIYEPKYISTSGEILINLPLILSAYLYLKYSDLKKKNYIAFILSGFSLGIAVLTNYKAGILAVVFVLFSLAVRTFFTVKGERIKSFIREFINLAFTGSAALIIIAIIVIYFYYLGNLKEFLFWGFTYNFAYIETGANAVSIWKTTGRIGYFIICSIPVWILICVCIFKEIKGFLLRSFCMKDGREVRFILFILLWTIFSFYAVVLGGRTYGHYFIQLIVPLSILAGIAYKKIVPAGKKKIYFWGYLALLNLIFFVSRLDINATYRLINYPNRQADIDYRIIGEYVKDNSLPGDKIYAWGWATPVYHYADRRCSSRFLISDFVSGRIFGTENSSNIIQSNINKEPGKAFISDLEKSPPEYFIDTSPADHYGYGRFPIKQYPELYNYILNNYKLVKSINKVDIYKRKFKYRLEI